MVRKKWELVASIKRCVEEVTGLGRSFVCWALSVNVSNL